MPASGRAVSTGTLLALDDLTVQDDPNEQSLHDFLFGTEPPPESAAPNPASPVRRAGDLAGGDPSRPRTETVERRTPKVHAFG